MKTGNVAEAVERVAKAAADTETRTTRRIEVGSVVHQGDVYLHRVDDGHKRGDKLGTRQVAVGTTVGSRHVVEGDGVSVFAGVALPAWVTARAEFGAAAYLGPVVVAEESFVLTHPEHAHHALPAGTYQVTYQVDETTRRRVAD